MHIGQGRLGRIGLIFRFLIENLADAIEAREGFGDLRADARDGNQRRRQQPDEEDIADEVTKRHPSGQDVAAANPDHDHADDTDNDRAARRGRRHARHRLRNVPEQAIGPLREDQFLALLGRVALDDADAAERFGEPAAHLGLNLPTLAEQRTQQLERVGHPAAEHRQHHGGDERQTPVEVQQHAEGDEGGHEATDQRHQAGADEVPDALRIGHDARQQDAGLGRVEVAHGQAHDLRVHPDAHVGDRPLCRHAQQLRQRKARQRLHHGRGPCRQRDGKQQVGPALAEHVVDHKLGERRQHHAREPRDQHQHEAHQQTTAVGI